MYVLILVKQMTKDKEEYYENHYDNSINEWA